MLKNTRTPRWEEKSWFESIPSKQTKIDFLENLLLDNASPRLM